MDDGFAFHSPAPAAAKEVAAAPVTAAAEEAPKQRVPQAGKLDI